jgi:hypothetical protein
MRRMLFRATTGGLLLTLLLIGLVLTFPGRRETFAGIYVLALGAVAVAPVLASLHSLALVRSERSPFERPPERPPRPEPLAELERIDRALVLAASSSFDVHHRLRPLLRELASERLYASHGVELDREPERARALLGDELWEIVRPTRELDRHGPGIPLAESARLVEAVERL